MNYRIKEFQMISTKRLYPGYDAEMFASDEDDRKSVKTSQDDVGTLQPLIVRDDNEHSLGRGWEVLDGLGRLRGALEHEDADGNPDPIKELPCLVVECDDPRNLSFHINTMGRRRSTGSRVLSYIEANWEKVSEAKLAASNLKTVSSRDDTAKFKDIPEELKPWGVREISYRLGVSDKDVSYAIELAQCHRDCIYPDICVHGRFGEHKPIEDENDEKALEKAYSGVLLGRIPIRRWGAAFAGKVNVKGGGKAATNYSVLARRSAISLLSCLEQWATIEWESPRVKEDTEKALAAMMANLPEICRETLIGIIPTSWPKGETANLRRALGK